MYPWYFPGPLLQNQPIYPEYFHEQVIVKTVQPQIKRQSLEIFPEKPKRRKYQRNKEKFLEEKNEGHWTVKENMSYHLFLESHTKYFLEFDLRKRAKIFKVMSQFLGSRMADQCRSHHQKMEKKYFSFKNIIKEMRMRHFKTTSIKQVKETLQILMIEADGHILSERELQDDLQMEEISPKCQQNFIKREEKIKIEEHQF